MREVSQVYKTLRNQEDAYYEAQVICGENTYTAESIVSIETHSKLFDGPGPQIGITCAAECDLVLLEESKNWPRMAEFEVQERITDGTTYSEWLSMGTYFTDERVQDEASGKLTITGYDVMLTTEQYWTDIVPEEDLPTEWPITSKAWMDLIVDTGIIVVDSRTVIDDTVPMIGLDTASTVRDKLKTIAAAHGGNWIVTPDNMLRLVPFANIADGEAAIAGIAIAGISVVGTSEIEIPDGIGMQCLNFKMQSFDRTPKLSAVSGVHLESEEGNVAEAGDSTGYVLEGECNFSDSDGVGELCLSKTVDYVYKPFNANKALLDPAAELGDIVIIDGVSYQIMSIDWNLLAWPSATIAASYEEEVDHEYRVVSEAARRYRKLVKEQGELSRKYTELKQSEEAFEIVVGNTYQTTANAKKDKEETERDLEAQAGRMDEFEMHYRFDASGETIGKTNSSKSIRLANDGISMLVDNETVVSINQDEMYSPRKVKIPLSGSLMMGDFLFQPRSSGNMSLLWVGETL